ncbi:MAG: hypothetical protein HYS70_04960 [Nitrospinae bacterium]|nr:hypothetical protein [Nitrospinota bacterium]
MEDISQARGSSRNYLPIIEGGRLRQDLWETFLSMSRLSFMGKESARQRSVPPSEAGPWVMLHRELELRQFLAWAAGGWWGPKWPAGESLPCGRWN